jgi:hypothetical protein
MKACSQEQREELGSKILGLPCRASGAPEAGKMWCAVFDDPVRFEPVGDTSAFDRWMRQEEAAQTFDLRGHHVVPNPSAHWFQMAAVVSVCEKWHRYFTGYVVLCESGSTIRCLLYVVGRCNESELHSYFRYRFPHTESHLTWMHTQISEVFAFWGERCQGLCGGLFGPRDVAASDPVWCLLYIEGETPVDPQTLFSLLLHFDTQEFAIWLTRRLESVFEEESHGNKCGGLLRPREGSAHGTAF